jgi:predicted permease
MPDWKQEIRQRLARLNLEPTREAEIIEELAQHLEDRYLELQAGGATREEAHRAALAELRNSQLLAQELRRVEPRVTRGPIVFGARRKNLMGDLWQDLRFSARMLKKNPAFTAIAVLTLALGIGANTAIFSLVNATLLRRLPVAASEQLVYVHNNNLGGVFSYPYYAELRDQNEAFESLIAWGGITASLNSDEQTDLVSGAIITGNYFETLGVRAMLGRVISPADDQTPGAHPVVVISHGLWQTRFGGSPQIIDQQVLLNGQSFTVIGVTPPEFGGAQYGVTRDFYVPMMMQAVMRPPRAGYSGEMNPDLLKVRTNQWLNSIGRLKAGVSREQAQTAMTILANPPQEPATADPNRQRAVILSPVNDGDPSQRSQMISVATLLMSVVGVVLLIACANVANLLLARASARRKEIAVRLAIGASRGRLIRQLLVESVLLASLGGAAGLLLGWLTIRALKAAPPPPGALPITPDYALDLRVLFFTLGLSMLAGILFGLAPALRASRLDLVPALKDESFTLDERTRHFSLRNILIVAQVALSLILLIAAGLFLRSARQAQAIDPGFAADKVLVASLNINLLRYTRAQGREFYRQVIERVEAVPGVQSASLARVVALSGGNSVRSLLIEGRAGPDNQFRSEGGGIRTDKTNSISTNVIGLNYFQTMSIALVRGRDFTPQDAEDRPRVVIVNEAFVQQHFADQEALGKRVSFSGTQGPWQEIIGVVRDSKYLTLSEEATPVAYLSLGQNHETGMTLHVRVAGEPSSVIAAVRHEVQALEKNLPVTNVTPLIDVVNDSLYAARMGAMLLGVFGGLALLLAAIGLYGVMSFSVSRRTREMGIRMALGAQARDVFKLVLKEGMALVLIGVVFGLLAAMLLTRLLTSFLYGISATDAMTFTGIPVILAAVALVACTLPARRATKVDPLVALRHE